MPSIGGTSPIRRGWARLPRASSDAAVAAAAHDVLLALAPAQQSLIQSAYDAALDAIPDGPAEDQGVALGQAAAAAILARRLDDGVAEAFATPYVPTGLPGDYPFTPPFDVPPLGPLAVAPGWGAVTPFGIDLDDHRLPGPDPITSLVYAFDLAYVKAIGDINSKVRSAEQSEIARFWYKDSPIGWNRIANIVLRQKHVGLWQSARILALVNFAMADGFIAGFDAKYHFRFWRPITAIRQAAFDGNRVDGSRRRLDAHAHYTAGPRLSLHPHGARRVRGRRADSFLRRPRQIPNDERHRTWCDTDVRGLQPRRGRERLLSRVLRHPLLQGGGGRLPTRDQHRAQGRATPASRPVGPFGVKGGARAFAVASADLWSRLARRKSGLRNADAAHAAVGEQVLGRVAGSHGSLLLVGIGWVKQLQLDWVEPELSDLSRRYG